MFLINGCEQNMLAATIERPNLVMAVLPLRALLTVKYASLQRILNVAKRLPKIADLFRTLVRAGK